MEESPSGVTDKDPRRRWALVLTLLFLASWLGGVYGLRGGTLQIGDRIHCQNAVKKHNHYNINNFTISP